jgi:hypothetical protein
MRIEHIISELRQRAQCARDEAKVLDEAADTLSAGVKSAHPLGGIGREVCHSISQDVSEGASQEIEAPPPQEERTQEEKTQQKDSQEKQASKQRTPTAQKAFETLQENRAKREEALTDTTAGRKKRKPWTPEQKQAQSVRQRALYWARHGFDPPGPTAPGPISLGTQAPAGEVLQFPPQPQITQDQSEQTPFEQTLEREQSNDV